MVVVFVFDLNDLPLVIKLRAGEDNSSGSGLENTGHNYEDLHTNIASAVFNHGSWFVIQISNSLIGLFALFDDQRRHFFPRQDDRFDRIGELVDIEDFHALQPGDFIEVEIIGDHHPI